MTSRQRQVNPPVILIVGLSKKNLTNSRKIKQLEPVELQHETVEQVEVFSPKPLGQEDCVSPNQPGGRTDGEEWKPHAGRWTWIKACVPVAGFWGSVCICSKVVCAGCACIQQQTSSCSSLLEDLLQGLRGGRILAQGSDGYSSHSLEQRGWKMQLLLNSLIYQLTFDEFSK